MSIAVVAAAEVFAREPTLTGLSEILWARHIMRGNEDGYAKQETNVSGSGCGPRAAA